ncbi:damage-inducible protein DinB [Tateyamaria omphalii]|uniref:DinB family protein n=1 Tax=Tateyamaria omphalii TaxID=299262 RepID=UPI0016734297|nr:DinB family protein [Tateyamaria omphalii]GGX44271.1 damage-inducible protein DinB [Tateyamaria omphalii]
MTPLFAPQAYNNAWSNYRLHRACAVLDIKELEARRPSFFGSIIATLNHILIVDQFYVSALEGACVGPAAFAEEVPYRDMPVLRAAQRDVDRRLIAVTEDATLSDPTRSVQMARDRGVQEERFDRTFLHLIQHQIHHRGQVHALLSMTTVPPPQLDEFYMAWADDARRRAPDLNDMGLSEADIWGGR